MSFSKAKYAVFRVEFQAGDIRRIAARISHPEALFYSLSHGPQDAATMDSVMNMSLEGIGEEDEALWDYILRYKRKLHPEVDHDDRMDRIVETFNYQEKELSQRRKLKREEYEGKWFLWAGLKVDEDFDAILSRGDSLADVVARVMRDHALATRKGKRATKEANALYRQRGNAPAKTTTYELWNGKEV